MSDDLTPKTDRMLARVRRRLYAARWTGTFLRGLFWCGLAAAAVVPLVWFVETVRIGPTITLWTVPAAVVLAAVAAMIFVRRPTAADAARAADDLIGSKDLFLTASRLRDGAAVGGYGPLVTRDAEAAAARVDPRRAAPIPFERPAGWAVAGLAAAAIAALLVPRFDPLGAAAKAEEVDRRREAIEASNDETNRRLAELKRHAPEAELSPQVEEDVEQLKQALRQLPKNPPPANRKALAERQKQLGEEWRAAAAKSLRDKLGEQAEGQSLGGEQSEELQKWEKELQQGSTESLRKELTEMKEELQRLAKETDPVKRAESLKKIEERLKKMDRLAKEGAGSKPLSAALQRAMDQLDAARKSGDKELSTKALESLKQSLDLTEQELQELAQTARDLKELEKALQTLQQAKKANEGGDLEGQDCDDCFTLDDYREFYEQMMAGQEGEGGPLGGEGIGEGGAAPEDDSAKTGFKTEQSKSAVTAGKILLSLQAKGVSDSGEASRDYRERMQEVRQGVSEAILQEQVPPGYHDSIKRYFDTLKPPAGEATEGSPE